MNAARIRASFEVIKESYEKEIGSFSRGFILY